MISPRSWSGESSQVHVHIYAAVFLGGLLSLLPVFLLRKYPGSFLNRMVVAVSQTLYSVLFIHLTGGRIETHFHVFGSLAFLAIYRDSRVLILGTLVVAADHLLRGAFWPQSVYGVLSASPWRALEHSAWVLFEDAVLLASIRVSLIEMLQVSLAQVELEDWIHSVEQQVATRTAELKRTIVELEESKAALIASSKMSSLGEMAGGIAHEINTPLGTIMLVAERLQLAAPKIDGKAVSESAETIIKTTERISKIVQGLKHFSRDASNDSMTSASTKELIENTLELCREKFRNHGINLIVEPFADEIEFYGNTVEISQVLLNLLNNSYDAVGSLPEKWVRISVVDTGSELKIAVTDSGKGISEKIEEKIFQPFFTTKEIGKGTGLGLSISVGIIQRHKGELKLDRNCENTRFVISLPKSTITSAAA